MMLPKFNILNYNDILNKAFNMFFSSYNDHFKAIDGKYVLVKKFTTTLLAKAFLSYVVETLSQHLMKYDLLKPNYYIVVGECLSKDNIMLDNNMKCIPKKLLKVLDSDYNIHYILKEKDISVDIVLLNDICTKIFDKLLQQKQVAKTLGSDYSKNVIFIKHHNLPYAIMRATILKTFGKANCQDININDVLHKAIVFINDILNKYCHKRCNSQKMQMIEDEIRTYLKSRLQMQSLMPV